jgi:hypothetical protein
MSAAEVVEHEIQRNEGVDRKIPVLDWTFRNTSSLRRPTEDRKRLIFKLVHYPAFTFLRPNDTI